MDSYRNKSTKQHNQPQGSSSSSPSPPTHIVHVIVDQQSTLVGLQQSSLRNELMNNVMDSLKEWALKLLTIQGNKIRLLFSLLKITGQSIVEEVIPVDELNLSSFVKTMKNSSDQALKSFSLSNSLSLLNSFLGNYMVGESVSTQVVFFSMNHFSKEDSIEEDFREMYNDNKDLHLVKVIHDFEDDVLLDQNILNCIENYPNIRMSSIFNDPICITRELFQSTRQLLKRESCGARLFLLKDRVEEEPPLQFGILSTGLLTDFKLGMKERLCLCHSERVNSNMVHQTLSKGYICSKTLKMIDHNDTAPALSITSYPEGQQPQQLILQANDDSISESVAEVIDIEVISKVHLSSVPYELLFDRLHVMVPCTDISFDIHQLEKNEGDIASLCAVLNESKSGLVCQSTSYIDGSFIKGSGIVYHYIIFPDSQCRCLYIQSLSTTDEIVPPVHIPVMSYSSGQLQQMSQKINNHIDTIDDFNPLHLSSKKLDFIYRTIKGMSQTRSKEVATKHPPPQKKQETRPLTNVQKSTTLVNRQQAPAEKKNKQLVKKIVFK